MKNEDWWSEIPQRGVNPHLLCPCRGHVKVMLQYAIQDNTERAAVLQDRAARGVQQNTDANRKPGRNMAQVEKIIVAGMLSSSLLVLHGSKRSNYEFPSVSLSSRAV